MIVPMRILGALGLIPFIAGLSMAWMNYALFGLSGLDLFTTYSALIASFMAGICWGMVLSGHIATLGTLILSNLLCLLAWGALLLSDLRWSLILLLAVYISLWLIDRNWQSQGRVTVQYGRLRHWLTLLVIGLHGLMLIHLILDAGQNTAIAVQ